MVLIFTCGLAEGLATLAGGVGNQDREVLWWRSPVGDKGDTQSVGDVHRGDSARTSWACYTADLVEVVAVCNGGEQAFVEFGLSD